MLLSEACVEMMASAEAIRIDLSCCFGLKVPVNDSQGQGEVGREN